MCLRLTWLCGHTGWVNTMLSSSTTRWRVNAHLRWGRNRAPVAGVEERGLTSPHHRGDRRSMSSSLAVQTSLAKGMWSSWGGTSPWARSPAGWEKKPEEVASSAGNGVGKVSVYGQIWVNNSFLGGKIHTSCKDMLSAPHTYTLLFALLISIFLYMPLIVWFIGTDKEYGICLIGQVYFFLMWCVFTHKFIILGYFGFQRVNAGNIL